MAKKTRGEKTDAGQDQAAAAGPKTIVVPRLQERYQQQVLPALREKLGRTNPMSLPRLTKMVVSMGVGAATQDKKILETAVEALTEIAGQKPVITQARKSIAGFRLREGMAIGCKVTLRRQRMYEFLDRLVSLALPRVRDFRGISREAFDGRGNYSLGLAEQLVFPELNPDKYLKVQGLNITLVTTAENDEDAMELLTLMGLPFRRDDSAAA
ncbi:MAG: 50S ribosomal protein L5 [Candidatus Anammoximicrobium sp.]|nr:50S ribosomal protein L5 [Candidatus Anammoximicrobium sp.]